jgi:hypothetical protein
VGYGVGTQPEYQPEGDALAGRAAIHCHLPRHGRPLLVSQILAPNQRDLALFDRHHVDTARYKRNLLAPTLAPEIVTAIVNGKNPPHLTAKKLMRLTPQIPVDWVEQRKLLGFQQR